MKKRFYLVKESIPHSSIFCPRCLKSNISVVQIPTEDDLDLSQHHALLSRHCIVQSLWSPWLGDVSEDCSHSRFWTCIPMNYMSSAVQHNREKQHGCQSIFDVTPCHINNNVKRQRQSNWNCDVHHEGIQVFLKGHFVIMMLLHVFISQKRKCIFKENSLNPSYRKQIIFSKRNFTFSFWGICFSNSILGAACDRSYVKSCVSHYHTPAFQAKMFEILMIFWVTLISPPVRVLNVEQSESLGGCLSEPTTARMFYSDIKSAGAVLLATPPFEGNAKVSKVPSAINAGAPAATI